MNRGKEQYIQDKVDILDKVPKEFELKAVQNLSSYYLMSLAQTSNYHLSWFKPMVDIHKLLHL